MTLATGIRVLVWDTFLKGTLLADLTARIEGMTTASRLHGGFSRCSITVPSTLAGIWLWLQTESHAGRHLAHVEILDVPRLVWEGRLMEIGYDPGVPSPPLELEFAGYWSACRDLLYSASDGTDWTTGGPHRVDQVIKELLTLKCPDINSDQSGIISSVQDVVGIDLTARSYPMDIIVSKLTMTTDGTDQLHFSVYDNRLPFLKKRSVATPTWTTYRRWLKKGSRLAQDAYELRNSITPVKDGTEGTEQSDSDSQSTYTKRELLVTVQKGTATAAEVNEAKRALAEKKDPHQSQSFVVNGKIYDTRVSGARIDRALYWVRAGDSIRVDDLLPASVSAAEFDNLRTFYILEAEYNWITNELTITPDRSPRRLSTILARQITVEADR